MGRHDKGKHRWKTDPPESRRAIRKDLNKRGYPQNRHAYPKSGCLPTLMVLAVPAVAVLVFAVVEWV